MPSILRDRSAGLSASLLRVSLDAVKLTLVYTHFAFTGPGARARHCA